MRGKNRSENTSTPAARSLLEASSLPVHDFSRMPVRLNITHSPVSAPDYMPLKVMTRPLAPSADSSRCGSFLIGGVSHSGSTGADLVQTDGGGTLCRALPVWNNTYVKGRDLGRGLAEGDRSTFGEGD